MPQGETEAPQHGSAWEKLQQSALERPADAAGSQYSGTQQKRTWDQNLQKLPSTAVAQAHKPRPQNPTVNTRRMQIRFFFDARNGCIPLAALFNQ